MPRASARAARIAAGLCPRCGGELAPGRSSCSSCLADDRRRRAARRARAAAEGSCLDCRREPAAEGRGGRCDGCADVHAERYRAARKMA